MKLSRNIQNPFVGKEGYHCFGCCPDNPIGLRLTFREEGDLVKADWMPDQHYEGFTGVLHGGIQATLLDEIGGWLVMVKLGTAGVTARMEVKYRRPFRMDSIPVSLEARVVKTSNKLATVEAKLSDSRGKICTEGILEYYIFDEEKAREELRYPGKEAFFID